MLTRRAFGSAALGFGAALALATRRSPARGGAPVVAAASDLRFALEEIATGFRRETGQAVRLVFGSTGNLARQIREGAPFELFLAADEVFVRDLAREGLTRDAGTLYAEGRLALAVPASATALQPDGTLETLRSALARGRLRRFAIANPEHAPYGMRAREALQHAGLWRALQPLLVLGENVAQAAQFALSGSTDGGIIAWSLALSPQLRDRGRFGLIPARWHRPLRQRMALLKGAGPVAEAFYVSLQKPSARAILARHGFRLPQ